MKIVFLFLSFVLVEGISIGGNRRRHEEHVSRIQYELLEDTLKAERQSKANLESILLECVKRKEETREPKQGQYVTVSQFDQLQKSFYRIELENKNLKQNLTAAISKINELKGSSDASLENINKLKLNFESSEHKVNTLESEFADSNKKVDVLHTKFEAGKQKAIQLENKFTASNEKLEELETKLQATKQKDNQMDNKLVSTNQKMEELKTELQAAKEKVNQLGSNFDASKQDIDELKSKMRHFTHVLNHNNVSISKAMHSSDASIKDFKNAIGDLKMNMQEIQTVNSEIKNKLVLITQNSSFLMDEVKHNNTGILNELKVLKEVTATLKQTDEDINFIRNETALTKMELNTLKYRTRKIGKYFKETCQTDINCIEGLICRSSQCQCRETIKHWNGRVCAILRECADLDISEPGVYTVYTTDNTPYDVYCQIVDGVKWTVFQRRKDGSVNFNRTWIEYKNGFGNINGEFWLGNDFINQLSSNGPHRLRVELTKQGRTYHASYSNFVVDNESNNYCLTVTEYTGIVGDSLNNDRVAEYKHNGMEFTSSDKDNDRLSGGNCAAHWGSWSGWWYNYCGAANLNRHPGSWGYDLGLRYTIQSSLMMMTRK